jgi:hypothetical protein
MKSAQKSRRINRLRSKNRSEAKKSVGSLIKFLLLIVFIVPPFLFVGFSSKEWDGKNKLTLTFPLSGGDVNVVVLDPSVNEITTVVIPGDTEVEVAASYGTLRLKNVWQLGGNEKLYGDLLAKTITKNFLLPVYLWSDSSAESVGRGNALGLFRFVFLPGKTNMTIGDRFKIAIFSLKVKNIDKIEIDLANNQILVKQILSDGMEGYVVKSPMASRLGVYFSEESFFQDGQNLRVYIVDRTGYFGVAQKMGQIIETLGGRVISIDRSRDVIDLGCEVRSKGGTAVNKIKNIFDCKIVREDSDFDLEITIGRDFAGEF